LTVHLVTPWAALVGLVVVVPVVAFVTTRRRAAAVRRAVDLGSPARGRATRTLAALVLSIGLLALAAAQPVVASHEQSSVRRDADVFVVIDTSRSMLAASRAGTQTRFARATEIARTLRAATPTAAVGIASLTDRVLPHLFPTQDHADFNVTLREAIAVQRPPPAENIAGSGTSLAALGDLATARFFAPEARTRVAVVLTDGESQPFAVDRVAASLRRARIRVVLIRLGNPAERVFMRNGRAEAYRPARGTGVELARTAALLGASAYAEPEARAAVAEVAHAVANGSGVERRSTTSVRELSPPLALAALFPVAFLVWRRNVG
jgi:hypothetical protein